MNNAIILTVFVKGKLVIPKDEVDLFLYLQTVSSDNISEIKTLIPALYENCNNEIKQELIDIIGDFELLEHLDLVKREIVNSISIDISTAAMVSLYDLIGADALFYIKSNCKLINLKEILILKCLEYIEFKSEDSLNGIKEIVLSPSCDYILQYNVLHIFNRYFEIHSDEKLVKLFTDILQISQPKSGIFRDIQKTLNFRD